MAHGNQVHCGLLRDEMARSIDVGAVMFRDAELPREISLSVLNDGVSSVR